MSNIYDEDYLEHHGILGQKWGERNGPPYPLDGSSKSVSEVRASRRKKVAVATVATTAAVATALTIASLKSPAAAQVIAQGAAASGKILAKSAGTALGVVATGSMIYAGEKYVEAAVDSSTSNKIISYGRQPVKKK